MSEATVERPEQSGWPEQSGRSRPGASQQWRSQARVGSAAVIGVSATPVEVEVDHASGLAQTVIVGLADKAVRESRDRVRAALRSCGLKYPSSGRLTINLAPAALRKLGPVYDLPIAVAILVASQQLAAQAREALKQAWLVGELALDGRLRPVRGVLPMADECRRRGVARLIVPRASAREAALVEGLDVLPFDDLRQVVAWLGGEGQPSPLPPEPPPPAAALNSLDLGEVIGQPVAKFALQLAAAGGHHLLMAGPPGVGKTMLASRLPGLLGPLSHGEALEVSRVYSVAGMFDARRGLISTPPFRAPHHSISDAALVGGGGAAAVRPGEVSLAHRGVLFLDEAPEFGRRALDSLRVPLELGRVDVARVGARVRYPARFQLVLALNPCPCGWHGAPGDRCRCLPREVERYQLRLTGPLLDRVDLQVTLDPVPPKALCARWAEGSRAGAGSNEGEEASKPSSKLSSGGGVRQAAVPTPGDDPGGTTAALREGVMRARAAQQARYGAAHLDNANAPDRVFRGRVRLATDGRIALENSASGGALSARGAMRVLRVSRTIADLQGDPDVTANHVCQALMLRRKVGAR